MRYDMLHRIFPGIETMLEPVASDVRAGMPVHMAAGKHLRRIRREVKDKKVQGAALEKLEQFGWAVCSTITLPPAKETQPEPPSCPVCKSIELSDGGCSWCGARISKQNPRSDRHYPKAEQRRWRGQNPD